MPEIAIKIILFIYGALVGSFLNVCIYRMPRDELSVRKPQRSFCPYCNKQILWYDNIPFLSYLFLGGKCRFCKKMISFRYFLVELLTCVLSLIVAFEFGISGTLVGGLLFTWLLIAITFIDLEHQIIPDVLTYPLLWIGLTYSCFGLFSNSRDAILGAAIAYLFFWVLGKAFYWVTKKEGIGHGDYKLLAAVGAWLGWELLPLVLLLSGLLGIVFGGGFLLIRKLSKNTPIPFGPFIALAAWVALIWGFDITQMYLHFFGIAWTNM
ncbi:MAG: A24 family peptidase [Gammaproteobacteria bacterium]|nr:A24 family peptidase [Gammaproteobacteria bacterium]